MELADNSSPVSVLLITLGAPYAPLFHCVLEERGILVKRCAKLPPNDEWLSLAAFDVVLITCPDDVDSEFFTIERIRDMAPMMEIVCSFSTLAVESAVETLRTGVYAVVPDTISSSELCEVIAGACRRRRRAEQRMRELSRSKTT